MDLPPIRNTDVPDEIYNGISLRVFWYSIAFIKIQKKKDVEEPKIMGSGTLIKQKGFMGILTADHVAKELRKLERVGFAVSEEDERFTIDQNRLIIDTIAEFEPRRSGPDLAIIRLPESNLGYFKAKKIFYDLDRKRQEILDPSFSMSAGMWCLQGCVDALSKVVEIPERNKSTTIAQCNAYFCAAPDVSLESTYDYLEFVAKYSEETITPESFGGVSGGGVWRQLVTQTEDVVETKGPPLFLGVPFLQDYRDDTIIIRCHGPKSVYERVHDMIEKTYLS
jgi:hypothetical protein